MSDANVNTQLKPQEVELERLEVSRRKWRKAALVFGWLALANVPLAMVAMSSNFFLWDYTFGFSIGWAIVAYALFSTIPYVLIAFVCMGIALSRKSSAASIRRTQQTN
jgi:hypothetical protein